MSLSVVKYITINFLLEAEEVSAVNHRHLLPIIFSIVTDTPLLFIDHN